MTSRFPSVHSQTDYESLRRDEGQLRPGVDAICDVLGLAPASLRRYPDGSLPVYAVGDSLVLKVYPPFDLPARDTESTVLQVVDGRSPSRRRECARSAISKAGDTFSWTSFAA